MKKTTLILFVIFVFTWAYIKLGGMAVDAITGLLPKSIDEWRGFIRFCLWFAFFWFTGGIAFVVIVIFAKLADIVTDNNKPRTKVTGNLNKSKFQQRLEEIAKERGYKKD